LQNSRRWSFGSFLQGGQIYNKLMLRGLAYYKFDGLAKKSLKIPFFLTFTITS
jgi:hypothetical protein